MALWRNTLHAISRALGHLRDANAAQARLNSCTTLPCYITYSRSGNSSAEPSGGACAASTSPQSLIAATKPAAMWPSPENVADQDIDRRLPFRLMSLPRDPLVRDYPRVVLCHRYEDENATAIAPYALPCG